jgi:hypothetical protein
MASVLFWFAAFVVLLAILSSSPTDDSLIEQAIVIATAFGTPIIPCFLIRAIRGTRKSFPRDR